MNASIDFARIAEAADLPAIMASRGVEVRNGKAFCRFHENHNTPAMTVFQVGGRWRFDCKACGASGDAIAFVALWDRTNSVEAARKLAGVEAPRPAGKLPRIAQGETSPIPRSIHTGDIVRSRGEPSRPIPRHPEPWDDPDWQEAADSIIVRAESRLWSPAGGPALEWLRRRGLLDLTIRRFRLGFVDAVETTAPLGSLYDPRAGRHRGIRAERGITIPWCHPEAWYHEAERPPGHRWVGCNVRRLMPDVFQKLPPDQEKCWAFPGSKRGYPYPFSDLVPGLPAVIVEGEWDALIAWQEFGWIANVVSVGSAKTSPKPQAMATLQGCPHWLLALHNDQAGNQGSKKWTARSRGKATRLMLPPEVDLNDMHLAGTKLRQWLRSEYETFGWSFPLDRTTPDLA